MRTGTVAKERSRSDTLMLKERNKYPKRNKKSNLSTREIGIAVGVMRKTLSIIKIPKINNNRVLKIGIPKAMKIRIPGMIVMIDFFLKYII